MSKSNPRPKHIPDLQLVIDNDTIILKNTLNWRYLGFFFDTYLTFKFHINFYANKAISTMRAMPLLGNAKRGLPPRSKHVIYISNVRPFMLYGHMVWYNARKPQKMLINCLSRAQAIATRWITGGFRTSPCGGLEIAASIQPFDLYLKRLHRGGVYRLHKLSHTHILVEAATPHSGQTPTQLLCYAAYVRELTTSPTLPLHELTEIVEAEGDEVFVPVHDECSPGARLVDQYPERFVFDLDAPPKADAEAFAEWMAEFQTGLSDIQADPSQAYAFADGSVMPNKQSRSAAAYRAFRGHTQIGQKAISTGKCVSYNAEMYAIVMALGCLTNAERAPNATDIHVFADNRAALRSIADTTLHPSQALSVSACRLLRRWLRENDGRVFFHWCPGHMNIPLNEQVDGDVKDAANNLLMSLYRSYAYTRQALRAKSNQDWQKRAAEPTYREHQFLTARGPVKVSDRLKTKNTLLALAGDSNTTMARLTRATLNHALTGEFRQKFLPRESSICDCFSLPRPVQTRHHILFHCPRYSRRNNFSDRVRQAKDPAPWLYYLLDRNRNAFSFADAPTNF